MKTCSTLAALYFIAAIPGQADIKVIFEHLLNEQNTPLPILKPNAGLTAETERFDGTYDADSYGGFERYDAKRLLLAVRENGIDERNAEHSAGLAAKFPDRSLVWIDPETGAPLGVALKIGINPVPLDKEFTDAGGTVAEYYFTFAVAEDGVIFSGYKNKLLRFEPDGNGGFKAPSVCYTHANDGSDRWYQWRYETIRATGQGKDTVLVAGGKTWRTSQGYREFKTKDGLTFEETDLVALGGGASRIIPAKDAATPNEEWIYGTLYPGSSNGVDTRILRFSREKGGTFGRSDYDIQTDPDNEYFGQFFSDTDVHPKFPYLVSYSTPSYNSLAINVDPARGGWLAVHSQEYNLEPVDPEVDDGKAKLIARRAIQAKENEELAGTVPLWHSTLGRVVINVLPEHREGQAELLWYSGIYGYGRYTLDFATGGQPAATPPRITLLRRDSVTEATITWTSTAGKTYDLETSVTLAPGSWKVMQTGLAAGAQSETSAKLTLDPNAKMLFARIVAR